MENPYPLTLEDLADRLGMSDRHLTNRKNGPITRVLETYYWLDLCDGEAYAETIVPLLEDYLADCGKRGDNHLTYAQWQEKVCQENGIDNALLKPSTRTLVQPPTVEVVSPDTALAALGDSADTFNAAVASFDTYFDSIGKQIGNRAVTRVAVATKKTIDDGLSQLLTNISKIGGN